MNVKQINPSELSLHPAVRRLPEWGNDDPRFVALVDDIRERGIEEPIKVTQTDRIIDGRHRWRAAKRLQLARVPVVDRPPEQVSQIVLQSLVQRRHYTKAALAYLVFPLIEPMVDQWYQKETQNIKNKGDSRSTIKLWLDRASDATGINREYLRIAGDIHRKIRELPKLQKHPEIWQELERQLLNEEIGLKGMSCGIGGYEATHEEKRPTPKQLELFAKGIGTLATRFSYWDEFSEEDRTTASKAVRGLISDAPEDLFRVIASAVRSRAREDRA